MTTRALNGPTGPEYDGTQPVAGYLGTMTCGTGISSGSGTIYRATVFRQGAIIKTEIFIDLTGLKSGGTAADIIGAASAANCHLGQVTTAVNGTIFRGQISCVETPATGEPDIDVYTADEATGTQDAAVTGLTETSVQDAAADYTKGVTKVFTGNVVANQYLYLVTSGGADTAVYTAGQFMIELWGYAV